MNLRQDTEYLPCLYCLGFYSRKRLWKHKKNCVKNENKCNMQVEGQNLLIRNLTIDKRLKDTVFPRMRPDKISLTAKSDAVICAFGAQYLTIHRDKHSINVTSRKMRELSKLLLEIKKIILQLLITISYLNQIIMTTSLKQRKM